MCAQTYRCTRCPLCYNSRICFSHLRNVERLRANKLLFLQTKYNLLPTKHHLFLLPWKCDKHIMCTKGSGSITEQRGTISLYLVNGLKYFASVKQLLKDHSDAFVWFKFKSLFSSEKKNFNVLLELKNNFLQRLSTSFHSRWKFNKSSRHFKKIWVFMQL